MDENGKDVDKKGKEKPRLLLNVLILGSIIVLLLAMLIFIPYIPREGWLNEKLITEGIITKIEFVSGSLGIPRTIIITFENGEIKQFKGGDNATFRAGARHIITHKRTSDFNRIIDVEEIYELKSNP